jgi:hypothetical protein
MAGLLYTGMLGSIIMPMMFFFSELILTAVGLK